MTVEGFGSEVSQRHTRLKSEVSVGPNPGVREDDGLRTSVPRADPSLQRTTGSRVPLLGRDERPDLSDTLELDQGKGKTGGKGTRLCGPTSTL